MTSTPNPNPNTKVTRTKEIIGQGGQGGQLPVIQLFGKSTVQEILQFFLSGLLFTIGPPRFKMLPTPLSQIFFPQHSEVVMKVAARRVVGARGRGNWPTKILENQKQNIFLQILNGLVINRTPTGLNSDSIIDNYCCLEKNDSFHDQESKVWLFDD